MSARRFTRQAVTMLALTSVWCAGAYASPAEEAALQAYLRPSEVPAPADNVPNAARVELGKALFFDPRLSGSNWISCATCHNPALGWSDALPAGIGHNGKQLGRATPTILLSSAPCSFAVCVKHIQPHLSDSVLAKRMVRPEAPKAAVHTIELIVYHNPEAMEKGISPFDHGSLHTATLLQSTKPMD